MENPPSGVAGYVGVLKIVYLDPTNLSTKCTASNANSDNYTKTGCMKWYAYSETSDTYTMILDHNTTASSTWEVAKNNNIPSLISDYNWISSLSPRMISAREIAQVIGETNFDPLTKKNIFLKDTSNGTYGWIYDRLGTHCTSYGCLNNGRNPSSVNTTNSSSYWTSDYFELNSDGSVYKAWRVNAAGTMGSDYATSGLGVRPVITVSKSYIS